MIGFNPTIEALGDEPFRHGSPGGEMKCPTCLENTPDAWMIWRPTTNQGMTGSIDQPTWVGEQRTVSREIQIDWMRCANPKCEQAVIRGHESYRLPGHLAPEDHTQTWFIYPRSSQRPVDPFVTGRLRDDYQEAAAILHLSPRMSAVLSRSILADLLEEHAKLTKFSLAARIDDFIADTQHPYDLRQNLHYLREIADLSAHTKKNDQDEIVQISSEEAEWTLDIIDRLFDYFIVSPAKEQSLRATMDLKLADAGRAAIKPLPDGTA